MNEMLKLFAKIEELEARCMYLGIIGSAMIQAWPDHEVLRQRIEQERQMQEANGLFSPISERQRLMVDGALSALAAALSPKPD